MSDFERKMRRLVGLNGSSSPKIKILCTVPTLGNVTHHESFYPDIYSHWLDLARHEKIEVELISLDPALEEGEVPWTVMLPERWSTASRNLRSYDAKDFDDTAIDTRQEAWRVYLEHSAVGKFYEGFLRRGLPTPAVMRGLTQAIEIINELSVESCGNTIRVMSWPIEPKEPPFHLVWTKDRAIVAVPLDRGLSQTSLKGVTLVGYETTDQDVLARLAEVFNEWRDQIEGLRTLQT